MNTQPTVVAGLQTRPWTRQGQRVQLNVIGLGIAGRFA